MAGVLIANGRFEEANSVYEEAIKHLPKIADLYALHARLILEWKNDFMKAKNLMTKTIEVDETCKLAYGELAQLENASGRPDRAIAFFDKAISLAIDPQDLLTLHKLKNTLVAEVRTCKKLGIDRFLFLHDK